MESQTTTLEAFNRWWNLTQRKGMTHSKYLAKKAWLAAQQHFYKYENRIVETHNVVSDPRDNARPDFGYLDKESK